jgi:hypothetical protein
MRYHFVVRFPLLKLEGMADPGKKPHFWARSGKMINKGQGIKKTGVVENYVEYAAIERGLVKNAANRRPLRLL